MVICDLGNHAHRKEAKDSAMMSRKQWLLGACIASLLMMSGCVGLSLSRPDPLQECCNTIKKGMTFDEASDILEQHGLKLGLSCGSMQSYHYCFEEPGNRNSGITLSVGRDSLVSGACVFPIPESPLDRMMRWLQVSQ
jgi:hypothetical protein